MRIKKINSWLVGSIFAVAGGCTFNPNQVASGGINGTGGSNGTGGHGINGITALSITPTTAMLSVTNGGPAQTQQYNVIGTVNGSSKDVTSQVVYSLSPLGIVTISPGGLATTTGTQGGVVTITASSGTTTSVATLTVNYLSSGVDPGPAGAGVPSDASSRFSSTTNDMTRAPKLVYPNDGVLFPPNVSGVEIHFMPGANNTLFEVTFAGTISTVVSYIKCTTPTGINGCIYLPDPGVWSAVASSNRGQGPVTLTVRGTDDAGSSVGASQTFHMTFARDDVMGALYYWTTSGTTAIMRWDFGGSTTTATAYLTPKNTDGSTCVGCHALALDGTKIVASAGGQNDGRLLLWNIATNSAFKPFPLSQKSQFESWNAAGTEFVGVYGDANKSGPFDFMIFDGTTGQVTSTIPLPGLRGDHPDWTKNNAVSDTIVFTSASPTAGTTDQRPISGGISFIQQNAGAWSAPQTLVPSATGKNRYYPSIAPDGNLVVFDESTCTNPANPDKSCDADTDATATMFLSQLPPADATPILLANANGPGVMDNGATALTNSYPKWAPFIENLDEMHKLIWMTFSSTRKYGLRSPTTSTSDEATIGGTLIWMVGIMPAVGGGDPSYTAFCLPFQDVTTSNHIAQWTQAFVQGPG